MKKRKRPTLENRRGVIMEPKERKIHTLMQQLNTIKNEKLKKKKERQKRRPSEHVKEKAKEEKELDTKRKTAKKKLYKLEGIAQLKKERAAKRIKVDKGTDNMDDS